MEWIFFFAFFIIAAFIGFCIPHVSYLRHAFTRTITYIFYGIEDYNIYDEYDDSDYDNDDD